MNINRILRNRSGTAVAVPGGMRRSASGLVLAVLGSAAVVILDAQSGVQPDIFEICSDYGQLEVVFLGTAGDPVAFHVSGAGAIEEARRNLERTEAEIERLRATLDPKTREEREFEFARTLFAARDELERRKAMYVPPYDLTLIPMRVERPLRGAVDQDVMVHEMVPDMPVRPGQQYLIHGVRSKDMLPPFPEMADMRHITEYIDVARAVSPAAAKHELDFASRVSGATIVGNLRMRSFGGGIPEGVRTGLEGVRIVVSSESRSWETTTAEHGNFVLTGLPAGDLRIQPVLAKDLVLTNSKAMAVHAREGSCETVRLAADLNGRVRGRITTAALLDQVTLRLSGVDPDAIRRLRPGEGWTSSHSPKVETSPNEDGTFELSGVPPGWYLLSATVDVSGGRRERFVGTYYPGTDEMGSATLIEIGRATEHSGFDFVVRAE